MHWHALQFPLIRLAMFLDGYIGQVTVGGVRRGCPRWEPRISHLLRLDQIICPNERYHINIYLDNTVYIASTHVLAKMPPSDQSRQHN